MTIKNKKFDFINSKLGQGAILISSLALPAIISTETKATVRPNNFLNGFSGSRVVPARAPLGGLNTVYGRMLLSGPDTHTRNGVPLRITPRPYMPYTESSTSPTGPNTTGGYTREVQRLPFGGSVVTTRNTYVQNRGGLGTVDLTTYSTTYVPDGPSNTTSIIRGTAGTSSTSSP